MDGVERRELLSGQINLRAEPEGDSPTIEGYAAVTGVTTDLGWFTEEIARGAFAAVVGDDVRALVDHDSSRILGRTSAKTLTIEEDETGLRMAIAVPDTSIGRDIIVSIKRGDIRGASFSFQVLDDEWSTKDGKDHRRIVKMKRLFDVGPVSFPAYEQTSVVARASRDAATRRNEESFESYRQRFDLIQRQAAAVEG